MELLTTLIITLVACGIIAIFCVKQVLKEQIVDIKINNTDVSIKQATENKIKIVNMPD